MAFLGHQLVHVRLDFWEGHRFLTLTRPKEQTFDGVGGGEQLPGGLTAWTKSWMEMLVKVELCMDELEAYVDPRVGLLVH